MKMKNTWLVCFQCYAVMDHFLFGFCFFLIVVYYIITPIFGVTFRVPICLYHWRKALLYSFQKFRPHSNVPCEVLGQQQSLNAVSSQVAKELQSLQQKDADSCFFFGGERILYGGSSHLVTLSATVVSKSLGIVPLDLGFVFWFCPPQKTKITPLNIGLSRQFSGAKLLGFWGFLPTSKKQPGWSPGTKLEGSRSKGPSKVSMNLWAMPRCQKIRWHSKKEEICKQIYQETFYKIKWWDTPIKTTIKHRALHGKNNYFDNGKCECFW